MQIDYLFDGGTPCDVEAVNDRTTRCTPYTRLSGAQWFYFCVKVEGVPTDGGRLIVQWPRRLTVEDLPPGASAEQISRETQHESFANVLPRTGIWSDDLSTWRRLESVEVDENDTVTIALPESDGPIYIATQQPYRWADWQALLDDIRATAPETLRSIGRSRGGRPMYTVCFDALEPVPGSDPAVFVQAYQHPTEFTGPHVTDAMIRHLMSDAGRPLRRRMAFDFMPVFHVDRLRTGVTDQIGVYLQGLQRGNPNRDWEQKTWPEVRAVDSFLRAQIAAGRDYRLGLDLHNGWSRADNSGACYTIFGEDEAPASYIDRQKALLDHLYARTDHEKPGRYWHHRTSGRFVDYFHALCGGLASTVEFSRHLWWDRASEQYVAPTPDHPRRYAVDALNAIATAPQLHHHSG